MGSRGPKPGSRKGWPEKWRYSGKSKVIAAIEARFSSRPALNLAAPACADYDIDLWYVDAVTGRSSYRAQFDASEQAIRICEGCPEKLQCLRYSLDNNEEFGVWGGVMAAQRNTAIAKGTSAEDLLGQERWHRAKLELL